MKMMEKPSLKNQVNEESNNNTKHVNEHTTYYVF